MADNNGRDSRRPMATLNDLSASGDDMAPQRRNLITILAVILVAVLLILVLKPNKLDVYKTVDELQFADAALARCVAESAAANEWADVGSILKLRCNNPSGDGIRSLDGIEHLVELTEINLAFNRISDATPLAALSRLENLDLSHNSITGLPVFRSAPNLKRIELNFNQIESLEWLTAGHFLALESFSVAHNHITNVDRIAALEGIRELSVGDNRIRNLQPIWQLRGLVLLDAGGNLVEDITGVEALANLGRLFLDRNAITDLGGVDELVNLEELDLSYNPLQSIAPLAGLERLQRLNLGHTGIVRLDDVLALGDLYMLRIPGNPDLACDDIARAVAEFGDSAVRSDLECP